MRAFAGWIGGLLVGRGLSVRDALVRAALMSATAVALTWASVALAFDAASFGSRHPAWQAPLLVAVALAFRVLYDLYELDRALSLSVLVATGFTTLAWLTAASVSGQPELATRAWIFLGLGIAGLAVSAWRIALCLRRDAPSAT